MNQEIIHFQNLISNLEDSYLNNQIKEFDLKIAENKWSKKEILGHLIDSALHNLQRFNEVQFSKTPYIIRSYNQNELVIANNYQNKDEKDLFNLWLQLNRQIIFVMQNQTEQSLNSIIILDHDQKVTLKFLMIDYMQHLEHHLNQIQSI